MFVNNHLIHFISKHPFVIANISNPLSKEITCVSGGKMYGLDENENWELEITDVKLNHDFIKQSSLKHSSNSALDYNSLIYQNIPQQRYIYISN